jgi:hypothetical protein
MQLYSYLVCVEKKQNNQCRSTAYIVSDENDNNIFILAQHNHLVRPVDPNIAFLRQELTDRALKKTVNSYTPRSIYMETIVE